MTSILQSKCTLTLAFCLVSWLGLLMLDDQCSIVGIAITLIGLTGIGCGLVGIIGATARQMGRRVGGGYSPV